MRTPNQINSPNIGDTKGNSPSPAYNPISPSYPSGVTPANLADPLGQNAPGMSSASYCPATPAYSAHHSKAKK